MVKIKINNLNTTRFNLTEWSHFFHYNTQAFVFDRTSLVIELNKTLYLMDYYNLSSELECEIRDTYKNEEDIDKELLKAYGRDISKSVVVQAQVIKKLKRFSYSNEKIMLLMPLLNLESSKELLRRFLHIAELPNKILEFLHVKSFSTKLCYEISQYPIDLLNEVILFEKKFNFSLSAGQFLLILDLINDIVKIEKISYETLMASQEIGAVLTNNLNSNQKMNLFLKFLKSKHSPMLTKINQKIKLEVDEFEVSNSVEMNWDTTLENQGITVVTKLKRIEDWDKGYDFFKRDSNKLVFNKIMENF